MPVTSTSKQSTHILLGVHVSPPERPIWAPQGLYRIDIEAFDNTCKEWMCEGTKEETKFIFDLFRFNDKYVWVPYDCIYKFYSGVHLCRR